MPKSHNSAAAMPPTYHRPAQSQRANGLFDPGSRMGRLMRSIDWSATELGPVDEWPECLKTPVRLMLASRSPTFVWWGPDLINLYNDACADIFGHCMTAEATGRPAMQVRHEIWSTIGPEVVEVMLGNCAAFHRRLMVAAESDGRLLERYMSVSLSPIVNTRGVTLGVFGTCHEETASVLSERRFETLRRLARQDMRTPTQAAEAAATALAADAHDIPFALIYLFDSNPSAQSTDVQPISNARTAHLAASAGSVPDTLAPSLTPDDLDVPWPLERVFNEGGMTFTSDLPRGFEACRGAVWPEPPSGAVVIALDTDAGGDSPAGFLILGVSSRLAFDEDYRSFFELTAQSVKTMLRSVPGDSRKDTQRHVIQMSVDEQKNEFLAMLAHELRNPLAPIRSATELLKYVDKNPVSLSYAREIIERQLSHLVRLMDDLLDVSRISRGKLQLRTEPIDLRVVAANAIESASPAIDESDHELTLDLPEEPVTVNGDAARLSQVIVNLLLNAAQYTAGGGHISLTLEQRDTGALFRVHDDGIGIPPNMLPRIFDMFTQVEQNNVGPRRGLGIGLTIAQQLIEMHGGTITAHSAGRNRGSEFVVRLPLLAAESAEATEADAPAEPREQSNRMDVRAAGRVLPIGGAVTSARGGHQPGNGTAKASTKRRRILVADDNKDAAIAIAEILGTIGHQVRTAEDGLEAIELAESFRPDLILLDIGMPRLDGYEACRRIRQRPWGRDVGIYAVTGWGQASDRRRTREAGFNAHLVKPVAFAAIERLISSRE